MRAPPRIDGDPNSVESGQIAKRKQPSTETRRGSVPRSKPVEYPLPGTVPDAPENIARSIFAVSPKEGWRYLKDRPSARRGD